MDLKDYKRIKKIDIKGWLVRGNAAVYALILIVFAAAVIFMFTTISSMFDNEENTVPEVTGEETQESTTYVAENQSYMLAVNKLKNYIVVYKMDTAGNFTNVYKVFRCSVAEDVPVGETSITEKFIWKRIAENVYGHYTVQLGATGYIHSVPYTQQDVTKLIADAYNNLGKTAQIGSISLTAADSKWIYENCGMNTVVKVYEDANENLDKELKELETIASDARFDPTDKEAASNADSNVVNTKIDYMTGTRDCTVNLNEPFDLWDGVYAKDINGNDITSYIRAEGSVDTSTPGVYKVIYYLNDNFGTNLKYYRYVTVTEIPEETTTLPAATTSQTGNSNASGNSNTSQGIHSGSDYTQQNTTTGNVNNSTQAGTSQKTEHST